MTMTARAAESFRQRLIRFAAAALLTVHADGLRPAVAAATPEPAEVATAAAAVDREVDRGLAQAKVVAAPAADDAEFLRRVTIDIVGRIPTLAETTSFLDSPAADKRPRLIDGLLASPEYGRHFGGDRWHRLMAPRNDAGQAVSPQFGPWLAEQFNRNRGWDRVVTDVLTAQGNSQDPATAFLMAHAEGHQPQPDRIAAASARLFLGVQLQCAQCHDHPFAEWKQDDFWATAAFFGQLRGNVNKGKARFSVTLTDGPAPAPQADSRGKGKGKGGMPVAAPPPPGAIAISALSGKAAGRVVNARILGDTGSGTVPPAGGPYRQTFAAWLTAADNPFFARAAVNRLWAHFFGRGFMNPVDDFRADNPATHPALLDFLSREFAASRFDQKYLIRVICNSRAYQRTSRRSSGTEPPPESFGRMAIKPMSATALYDSLFGLTRVGEIKPTDARRKGTPREPRELFAMQFDAPADSADPTELKYGIPQFLRRLNADYFHRGSPLLDRLPLSRMSRDDVVSTLYLATLSRRPTAQELTLMSAYLDGQADAGQGYAGVLWILLNTGEFISNH